MVLRRQPGAVAIGTGLIALLVMLGAGILGARYHRGANEMIANTRPGGVAGGLSAEDRGPGRVVLRPADGNGAAPAHAGTDRLHDRGRS